MATDGTRYKTLATVGPVPSRADRTLITVPSGVLPPSWFEDGMAHEWSFQLRNQATNQVRDNCGTSQTCEFTEEAAANMRVRLVSGTDWVEIPWWGNAETTLGRRAPAFIIFSPTDSAVQAQLRAMQRRLLDGSDHPNVLLLIWRPGVFGLEEDEGTPEVAWALRVIGRDRAPAERENEAWGVVERDGPSRLRRDHLPGLSRHP